MKPLVILRPEPGASATAAAARKAGLDLLVLPLFEIEPIQWSAPEAGDFDGLLLTSANAIRFGGLALAALRSLPVHAVGEATAAVARDFGFEVETVGSSGVDALLCCLPPDLRLLHLCGEDRRLPATARHEIVAVPVYRAAELPCPAELAQIEEAVVLVHSPRAGARLNALAGRVRERISIAAISANAAAAAAGGWQRVEIASEPSERALLALAARLCQNRQP